MPSWRQLSQHAVHPRAWAGEHCASERSHGIADPQRTLQPADRSPFARPPRADPPRPPSAARIYIAGCSRTMVVPQQGSPVVSLVRVRTTGAMATAIPLVGSSAPTIQFMRERFSGGQTVRSRSRACVWRIGSWRLISFSLHRCRRLVLERMRRGATASRDTTPAKASSTLCP